MPDDTATIVKPDPNVADAQRAQPWLDEIERAERVFKDWHERCNKIRKLYTKERAAGTLSAAPRRFSLLWANIQTLQPAVYTRAPKPVVSRRFKDSDPTGRTAAEVIERATAYSLDVDNFDVMMRGVRDDTLLDARGTAWVRYEPETEQITPEIGVYEAPLQSLVTGDDPEQKPEGMGDAGPGWRGNGVDAPGKRWKRADNDQDVGDQKVTETEDGSAYVTGDTYEAIRAEHCRLDYVHRNDFLHSPARVWQEVWWVARKSYLTRGECKSRFGDEVGGKISLDHKPPGTMNDSTDENWKAVIWEVWSKRDKKVIFVSPGYADELDRQDPFLKLSMFWPCPQPTMGTTTTDSLVPIPDYVFYQDQAEEIDELTAKIGTLTKKLSLKGFYPGGPSSDGSDAIRIAMDDDLRDVLVAIPGWSALMEKGGAAGIIQWIPIQAAVAALQACVEMRKQLLEDVYQITGLSDIVRGDTDPNETATAQQIKGQWGSLRIRDRQAEFARFAREIVQIMGEVIAQKFQPDTLQEMTGIPLVPEQIMQQAQAQMQPQQPSPDGQPPAPDPAMQQAQQAAQQAQGVMDLLRNNITRGFRIDIETDSTVQVDEEQDKAARTEFAGVLSSSIAQIVQAISTVPPQIAAILIKPLGQGLLFLARGYRVGREMEDTIEEAIDQIAQAIQQQASQPPQPDPTVQLAQQRAEAETAKAQLELQQAQVKAQADGQAAQGQQAVSAAQTQAKLAGVQADVQKMQVGAAVDAHKAQTQVAVIDAKAKAAKSAGQHARE